MFDWFVHLKIWFKVHVRNKINCRLYWYRKVKASDRLDPDFKKRALWVILLNSPSNVPDYDYLSYPWFPVASYEYEPHLTSHGMCRSWDICVVNTDEWKWTFYYDGE